MDKDYCPESDTVIMPGLCNYKGVEVKDGQRCIVCTFYAETNNDEE